MQSERVEDGHSRKVSDETHPGYGFARLLLPNQALVSLTNGAGLVLPIRLLFWFAGIGLLAGYFIRSKDVRITRLVTAITGFPIKEDDDVRSDRLQLALSGVSVVLNIVGVVLLLG